MCCRGCPPCEFGGLDCGRVIEMAGDNVVTRCALTQVQNPMLLSQTTPMTYKLRRLKVKECCEEDRMYACATLTGTAGTAMAPLQVHAACFTYNIRG